MKWDAGSKIEFELRFEDNHWNHNCGCMIPAAWVAFVWVDGDAMPKWPCGMTSTEARANVKREHPGAVEI